MQEIANRNGKNKTWRNCKYVVLHSAAGRLTADLRNERFIESLLDPAASAFSIPWTPVVVRDTLHLIHVIWTPCEGEA